MTRLRTTYGLAALVAAVCFSLLGDAEPAEAARKRPDFNPADGEVTARTDGRTIKGTVSLRIGGKARLAGRTAASDCNGCEWIVQTTGDIAVQEGVPAARLSVPCWGSFRRVYFRPSAGATPQQRGEYCLAEGEDVASDEQVDRWVRANFKDMLPAADPSFQPAHRVLVNMPTIFSSGQGSTFVANPRARGVPVRLFARAHWLWHFDDGVVQRFHEPGGEWPNDEVSYTYTTLGDRRVRVETVWRVEYSINGEPPISLGETSDTSASLPLRVVEARSQLVAPD